MKPRRYASLVTGGKLDPVVSQAIEGLLRQFEGKRVAIRIEEWKKRRSRSQNSYWWAVVIEAVREMFREHGEPMSAEETHEFLQREVLKRTKSVIGLDGGLVVVTESSTEKTPEEWEQDTEMVRAWAAQFGVVIPRPREIESDMVL